MKPLQILRTLAGVAALGWMALAPAQAQVTVRMMHVDQNPNTQAFYADMARRYEAMKPGVKVEVVYLENQAYKSKLTTLLQSPERPNIIYSWGGGVMRDQVKAGVIEDLTAPMNAQWKERFIPSAIQSFTLDKKILGVPFQTAQVGFFYNKDLFAKAKVDGNAIKTWPDLLAAVKKLQAAGITPIITGGPTNGRCTSTGRTWLSAPVASLPLKRHCVAKEKVLPTKPLSTPVSCSSSWPT